MKVKQQDILLFLHLILHKYKITGKLANLETSYTKENSCWTETIYYVSVELFHPLTSLSAMNSQALY